MLRRSESVGFSLMARRNSRADSRTHEAGISAVEGSWLRRLGVGVLCAKVALVPLVFDHALDWPFTVAKGLTSHAFAYLLAAVLAGLLFQYGRGFLTGSPLH